MHFCRQDIISKGNFVYQGNLNLGTYQPGIKNLTVSCDEFMEEVIFKVFGRSFLGSLMFIK